MHGRILNLEHAPQEVLQQEIEALRREYQENERMLKNNLRFSRAPSVAALCQAYTEVEKVLERLREQMEEESRENKAAQSGGQKETSALMENDPVEEKLLFAEYAIDFAMQAADRALLISMEATEAEQAKKERAMHHPKKEDCTMKEVKNPRKPLIYYYGIAVLVIFLFNLIVTPVLMNRQVKEVDYGTFMEMIDKKNIGKVEVDDSEILFTDKENETIYKTGAMNDPTLTQRLYDCGAKFSKDVDQTMSPLLSGILSFVVPLLIFFVLGQYMSKKLIEQAGGKNAMKLWNG